MCSGLYLRSKVNIFGRKPQEYFTIVSSVLITGEKTYGKIGVVETIIGTAFSNLIFGLFSGQPLILYGATGPVLVFEKHLFYVSIPI